MPVLIINSGSTSIKAAIVDPANGRRLSELKIERLGTSEASATFRSDASLSPDPRPCPATHSEALASCLTELISSSVEITSVGHRVVHGGTDFIQPTLISDEVLRRLDVTASLAPLHNPKNIAGIRAALRILPKVKHVAVFDTAFHNTLPNRAKTYALPADLNQKHQLRRFGFHGTSHQFVAHRAAAFLQDDVKNLRIITCHLGGGCSLCAIEYGRSIETSMGMTPLEGLVMGTRAGDTDVGALLHVMRLEGLDIDELDTLLNRKSGIAGLSRIGSDLRDIEAQAEQGNDDCRLAIQVFCHRVRKYIGAYAAVMGGVDAIVFTAGIGQNSSAVRHRVGQRLEYLGARFDEDLNRTAAVSHEQPVSEISAPHSRTKLLVVETDEAWAIAQQTHAVCSALTPKTPSRTFPIAISARHVHLTQETVEALFGDGHQLTPLRELSQPGQFAAEEEVILVGPKRQIERVRVLGPTRSKNQVEISRTDEFFLGLDAPIRASGDVANTPGITLIGADGRSVTIENGVICAWRHIHMTPKDAQEFGVKNGDVVDVEVGKAGVRSLTFGDVLIRVKESYKLEMHIDTDEGNAAELSSSDIGELEQTDAEATLVKRCDAFA